MATLTIATDVAQQILSAVIDLKGEVASLHRKFDVLEARVDSLEANLNNFRIDVAAEFNFLREKVTVIEKKVVLIESRHIDVEQKLIALEVQSESRFYSLEVLLERATGPISAKNKNTGKSMAGSRING
ncbi:hypothetical protein [Chitinophaga sp. S165]|uniref:hypothetical protein n=1 Tax=Chitinophaga sp. S165 TaxID=2135462 RepID=UPI000D710F10|nr:hypothetical protein [Chitinophaga sp. S165]PWV56071.1 hypothetical protein C7475_101585 [Chitinophaga sp. S165]